jgi:hypothetical protein
VFLYTKVEIIVAKATTTDVTSIVSPDFCRWCRCCVEVDALRQGHAIYKIIGCARSVIVCFVSVGLEADLLLVLQAGGFQCACPATSTQEA